MILFVNYDMWHEVGSAGIKYLIRQSIQIVSAIAVVIGIASVVVVSVVVLLVVCAFAVVAAIVVVVPSFSAISRLCEEIIFLNCWDTAYFVPMINRHLQSILMAKYFQKRCETKSAQNFLFHIFNWLWNIDMNPKNLRIASYLFWIILWMSLFRKKYLEFVFSCIFWHESLKLWNNNR